MKYIALATACFALAGCQTTTDPNFMTVDRDGTQISGKVGSNWSDEELRNNAFGALCNPGETISDLRIIRDETGAGTYSARCL